MCRWNPLAPLQLIATDGTPLVGPVFHYRNVPLFRQPVCSQHHRCRLDRFHHARGGTRVDCGVVHSCGDSPSHPEVSPPSSEEILVGLCLIREHKTPVRHGMTNMHMNDGLSPPPCRHFLPSSFFLLPSVPSPCRHFLPFSFFLLHFDLVPKIPDIGIRWR